MPNRINLPEMEREVIGMWESEQIFHKSLNQRDQSKSWIFYEGPPTANGKPGAHHVEARVFKDVFPRFKAMQGYYVPRYAGWDCHGLPVELAVEKELGFTGKNDIEKFGVAEFLSAVAVADWLISADVFVCVAIWDIYSRIDTRLNLKFSLPS